MTDMHESKWIPAVMSRALGKMLIHAALCLYGWISMRHGVSGHASNRLGCYFSSP